MTYATPQDLIDRFGEEALIELTDRARMGVIDMTVLGQALADADAEIDSYLVNVCSLPLTVVPPRLTKLAADIAYYEMHGAKVEEQVRAKYTDAIRLLRDVKNGTASLGLGPLNQPLAETGGVGMKPKAPVLGALALGDY